MTSWNSDENGIILWVNITNLKFLFLHLIYISCRKSEYLSIINVIFSINATQITCVSFQQQQNSEPFQFRYKYLITVSFMVTHSTFIGLLRQQVISVIATKNIKMTNVSYKSIKVESIEAQNSSVSCLHSEHLQLNPNSSIHVDALFDYCDFAIEVPKSNQVNHKKSFLGAELGGGSDSKDRFSVIIVTVLTGSSPFW